MPHVYLITCAATGETYVGSSMMSEGRRWMNHRSLLRAGRHKSPAMQSAYDRHGEGSFSVLTLETCPLDRLLECEQKFMDQLQPAFNVAPRPGPITGLKRTPKQVAARRASFHTTALAQINANPPRYEVRGDLLSSREISAKYGINLNTVKGRLRRGLRGEELIR